jgi:hypothetical protein
MGGRRQSDQGSGRSAVTAETPAESAAGVDDGGDGSADGWHAFIVSRQELGLRSAEGRRDN